MWRKQPDLGFNVVNHQTISISNIIYIIGGYKNSASPNYEQISVYVLSRVSYCVRLDKLKSYQWDCSDNYIQSVEHSVNPIDRYGHTVIVWKQMGVLFGGCNDQGYCDPDIYLFIPGKKCAAIHDFDGWCGDGERWVKVKGIDGNAPLRRDGHSVAVQYDHMYVYGGLVSFQTRHYDNKLYQLDFNSWQWSIVYQGDYLEPLGRDFGHLLAHNHSLYLIGGRSDNCFNGNSMTDIYDTAVWKFDLQPRRRTRSWRKIHPGYGIICDTKCETNQSLMDRHNTIMTLCPQPRRSFMAAILKDEIILFGGLYETSEFSVHFNDIWSFNICQHQWRCISSVSSTDNMSTHPVPLRKSSLTKLNNHCMLLIGGVTTLNNNANNNITKITGKGLSFPINSKHSDFNLIQGMSLINTIANIDRQSVTLYHKGYTPLAGSIETINDLTLRSTGHVFLLQPLLSLYQKALAVVVTMYSSHQLRNYPIPTKITLDIESIRISPDSK